MMRLGVVVVFKAQQLKDQNLSLGRVREEMMIEWEGAEVVDVLICRLITTSGRRTVTPDTR